ncbi:MAG: inner membrane CreD family protein, partial [Gammaproteobacteria bacterium]
MIYGLLALLIMIAVFVGIGFLIYLLVRKIKQSNTNVMTNLDNLSSENTVNKKVKNMNDTLTIRGIIVGVCAIGMLIPLVMMQGVVDERNGLYSNVLHDRANTWGGQQLL